MSRSVKFTMRIENATWATPNAANVAYVVKARLYFPPFNGYSPSFNEEDAVRVAFAPIASHRSLTLPSIVALQAAFKVGLSLVPAALRIGAPQRRSVIVVGL